MSADLLREAAALMRERAGAITGTIYWKPAHEAPEDSAYIASWHPAVALAVADWLEAEARWVDIGAANSPDSEALAVARAYLRSES